MTYNTYADARAYYLTLDPTSCKLELIPDKDEMTWRVTYYSGTVECFTSPIKD